HLRDPRAIQKLGLPFDGGCHELEVRGRTFQTWPPSAEEVMQLRLCAGPVDDRGEEVISEFDKAKLPGGACYGGASLRPSPGRQRRGDHCPLSCRTEKRTGCGGADSQLRKYATMSPQC